MNDAHFFRKSLLALSLTVAVAPLAVQSMSMYTPCQAVHAVGEAVALELRETFYPGKLVRWAETALELPGAIAELFEAETLIEPGALSLEGFNTSLSFQIRQYHDLYFEQIAPDEYTVVRYRIDAQGSIGEVEVLPDATTAPADVAELAAQAVRSIDSLPALPDGVHSAVVTELFWTGGTVRGAGAAIEHLSQLPDGREIVSVESP